MREKISSMYFLFEENIDTKYLKLTDKKMQAKQNFLTFIDFPGRKCKHRVYFILMKTQMFSSSVADPG